MAHDMLPAIIDGSVVHLQLDVPSLRDDDRARIRRRLLFDQLVERVNLRLHRSECGRIDFGRGTRLLDYVDRAVDTTVRPADFFVVVLAVPPILTRGVNIDGSQLFGDVLKARVQIRRFLFPLRQITLDG